MHKRIEAFKEIMSNAFNPTDVDIMGIKLAEMGFFTAPASATHNGNSEGGLFVHSLNVTKALLELTEKLGLQWDDPRSPYVVGMFHDLCLCDEYVETPEGYKRYEYQTLTGHGDKSVILAQQLIALTQESFQYMTDEEILCIRWHMGAFDDKSDQYAYECAIAREHNVLFTHTADMISSQIWGY